MKEMKNILIVLGLVSALSVSAQTLAQQPSNEFQSTSTMSGSGSAYSANPTLNTDGTATYQGASYSPKRPGPIRKVDWEGEKPNLPSDSPLGDAVWPLLLCAAVFCGVIALRRKRSALKS